MKTLFKNGLIIDGSGSHSYVGSLVIEDGTIRDITTKFRGNFDGNMIDCSGKVIAPGFIDTHSHNDWYAARKNPLPYFRPFAEQGITSQVTGNCGFSPFGYEANTPYKSLIGSGLFETGETFGDYSTLSGWREAAEKTTPLNLIPLQGHGSVRIGLSGYENRVLTENEIALHNAKIGEAFDQGAFGLSFGLMYEPDRYATTEELEQAAKIVAKRDGIITVHSRAQSAASTSYNPPTGGEAHNIRALKEMIELTRRTGVRMQYSHHIFVGKSTWKTVDESLNLIDDARAEGLDFAYDMYAMPFGVSVITVILPSWYLSMPKEKRNGLMAHTRLAVEIAVTKRVLGFSFDDIQVAWAGENAQDIYGKRISEIAAMWLTNTLDAYIKVVEMSEGKGRVNMFRYYNDDIINKLMCHEPSLFMTDAWIEEYGVQNAAAFSCFPRFLELSREKKLLTLEQTVRKMSGATADRFGIANRGYLKKGYAADVTVFDPTTVSGKDDPSERPEGICHVFVNGIHAVENGLAKNDVLMGAGTIITKDR